jgi:hypothetical protein
MSMTEVRRIAAEVAHEESPSLEVSGIHINGGSGYSEVLMTIRGCRTEPCQIAVGVFRDLPEPALRQEIATALRRHLSEHPPAA